MTTTQAVLPRFRRRKSGVIVNATSRGTLRPMPLAAAYTYGAFANPVLVRLPA